MVYARKKKYFLITLTLMIFSCKNNTEDKKVDVKLTPKEIYSNHVNNTVTILTSKGQGSGFFIDKNMIITNYHVLQGADRAQIILNNSDKKIEIKGYLSVDKINDLILLIVDYNNSSFIELEKKIPKPGEKVFALGSPIGLNKTISEGIVSGIRDLENNKLIQITTPITHGSSGCPIINEYGKLIGVAVGGVDNVANISFCIPSNYINTLIDFKESYPREINTLSNVKNEEIDKSRNIDNNKTNKEENLKEVSISKRFLGKHLFSTYGIDFLNSFGTATIKLINGKYLIDAFQKNKNGNFIKIKGEISILNINKFIFKGKMYVYNSVYNSELGRMVPETCESNADLIFEARANTPYWEAQNQNEHECNNFTIAIQIFTKVNPRYEEVNYP